jgi:hypothetical protein
MENPTGESSGEVLRLDFDRRLMLQFRGSVVTSDAGLLAYRELDDALGLATTAGEMLADACTDKNGRHALVGLLRQSVFGRLAGYEDVNDAERLRHDPAMRWRLNCFPSVQKSRERCVWMTTESRFPTLGTPGSPAWVHGSFRVEDLAHDGRRIQIDYRGDSQVRREKTSRRPARRRNHRPGAGRQSPHHRYETDSVHERRRRKETMD